MNKHVKDGSAIDPSWSNPDAAIAFLRKLRPDGPWVLSAIYPSADARRVGSDTGPVPTKTFTEVGQVRAWIAARSGRANIYFTLNRTGAVAKKPTKNEITAVEYAHVDIDSDSQGALAGDSARKAAVVARLRAFRDPGPPTLLVDSGGGLQALWRLNDPATTREAQAECGRMNEALISALGGDGGTWSIDHLMRLPGTVNLPTAKKLAQGRISAPAVLVEADDHAYDRWLFAVAPKRDEVADVNVEFGPAEEVTDLGDLATKYRLSERIVATIQEGHGPVPKEHGDNSRSGWLFSAVLALVHAGVPNEIILGIITDPQFGIAESVLAKDNPDDYAARQVRSALSLRWAQIVAGFPDDLSEEDVARLGHPVEAASVESQWERWIEDNFAQIGQIDVADIPHTPWLVEGLLLYRDITLIGGRGGVGKSLHAWQIAVAVAMGRRFAWWDAPVSRRPVLVISGEDDVTEIERRVSAACQSMGVDRGALAPSLMVWKHRNIRLVLKDLQSGAIERTKLWRGVRWAIENLGVGLVVIDPLVKASGGFDESGNVDMDALFEEIRHLTDGHDCAVLIDDHFSKGGIGGDQASIRGASAKVDASRIAITLTAMTETEHKVVRPPRGFEAYVRFVDAKVNYSRKQGTRWLEFVDYQVGNGEIRPALVARNLGALKDFEQPDSWEHREAFLDLVRNGRTDERHKGWPWCTTTSGQFATRLDMAVAGTFEMTRDQAQSWIEKFARDKLIEEVEWTSPTKNKSTVWQICADANEEETGDE